MREEVQASPKTSPAAITEVVWNSKPPSWTEGNEYKEGGDKEGDKKFIPGQTPVRIKVKRWKWKGNQWKVGRSERKNIDREGNEIQQRR